MIIGNNKIENSFQKKFNETNNKTINTDNDIFKSNKKSYNVNNKNDMLDKSLEMLRQRYANGNISIEEFRKKCNELNKNR